MYEIIVYKDNEEKCRCTSLAYLKTFFQEAGSTDGVWVKFKGDFYPAQEFLNEMGLI